MYNSGSVHALVPSKKWGTKFALCFWEDVQVTEGCWWWRGPQDGRGVGIFNLRRGKHSVRHVAWELALGAVPAGFSVAQRCANRLCCNPDHLTLRPRRAARRRVSTRELSPPPRRRKLSAEQVAAISKSPKANFVLALEFGVSITTIRAHRADAWRGAPPGESRLETILRFTEVLPSGCWLWLGLIEKERPRLVFRGHTCNVRRAVVEEVLRQPAPKGNLVMSCDKRDCINPRHVAPQHGAL